MHYCFFWSNIIVTVLFNSYWVYLFLRVVLDSQKAHQLCSKIFSLLLTLFWAWICINEFLYGEGVKLGFERSIMLGYGIMLSLMQYCFIGAINSSIKNTILTVVCLVGVIGSIYLLNGS